jgi:hypothetical protein
MSVDTRPSLRLSPILGRLRPYRWFILVSLIGLLFAAFNLLGVVGRGPMRVYEPADGSHVAGPTVVVRGRTSPLESVLRDVRWDQDAQVTATDRYGNWSCIWYLKKGKNEIRLHTRGREDHVTITVYNDGPAADTSSFTLPPDSCEGWTPRL